MIEQKPSNKLRGRIILLVLVLSVVLYFAGVLSGLYANSILKKETQEDITNLEARTKEDIETLKQETEQYLDVMENYIDFLDTSVRDVQLEQTFLDTLDSAEQCAFLDISLNELLSKLGFYWDRLPYRIEEYERFNVPTEEYLILKEQYTQLSIQIWSLAKKLHEQCDADLNYGLYFYSADCEDCVSQGEQLDRLKSLLSLEEQELILFPVDFDSEDSVIKNLRAYYQVNATPALLINDEIFQGKLFSADELFANMEE